MTGAFSNRGNSYSGRVSSNGNRFVMCLAQEKEEKQLRSIGAVGGAEAIGGGRGEGEGGEEEEKEEQSYFGRNF